MSDDEIKQATNPKWVNTFWREFPVLRRSIFLLNKRKHGQKDYNPGRELHGEVIAIHFGEIERLMTDFKNNPKTRNKYPIMLLYSHYIPCAKVKKLGYSCSEELMNYAKGRSDQFVMLVGYTDFYEKTNKTASMDFMINGGVNAFMHIARDPYLHNVKAFPKSSTDVNIETFQANYMLA